MRADPYVKKPPRPPARTPARTNRQPRFPRELGVIFEDDALVVLDKPPGLPAVPIEGSKTPSAWAVLSAELGRNKQRAFVVHRIDRFASGILLFAKTERDRDVLVKQFLAHTPERQYQVVVRGYLPDKAGTLVHHMKKDGMHQQVRRPGDPKAARAELRYTVERVLRDASLVRVTLVTGLQNQIRAQFAAMGHPVVGDRKYTPAEASETRIDRVALHAAGLGFVHPRSGEKVSFHCKLPKDIRRLVKAMAPPEQRAT
jgi:23S rRNA pseudouridine1911/1915/1917 synthase